MRVLGGATLVFIYGPPAAGKLTVANVLAERIGYKVFHNHASFDLAASALPAFSSGHVELVEKIRLEVMDAAARSGVGLIFTMVYGHPEDQPFVLKVEAIFERAKGRVCYVQLRTDREELESRVVDESRAAHGKLRNVEGLREVFEQWDMDTPIHDTDLSIDNTNVPAHKVAEVIQKHFDL